MKDKTVFSKTHHCYTSDHQSPVSSQLDTGNGSGSMLRRTNVNIDSTHKDWQLSETTHK